MLKVNTGFWKADNSLQFVGSDPAYQSVTVLEASSKESYSLPNYRYLIDHGMSATTRFLATKQAIKVGNPALYVVRRTRKSDGVQGGMTYQGHPNYGQSGSIAPLDNSYFQSLDNQLIGIMSQKLINLQRSLAGGTVIGELRETISMIRHPLKGLKKGWHDYLNLLKKRGAGISRVSSSHRYYSSDGYFRTLSRVASETYLERAFGWQPLVSDLDDAMRAIADLQFRTYPPRKVVSAFLPFSYVTDRQQLLIFNSTRDGNAYFDQCKLVEGFVKLRACSVLKTDGEPGVLETLGLTLENFVPTVWNLLPFSFLVDYVTNVGVILDAVSMGSVLPAWGVYTRKYWITLQNEYHYDIIRDPLWVYNTEISIEPKVDISYEYTDRRISNGPYVPELRFTADLSWRQITNMTALAGVFSSTSKSFVRHLRR